MADEITSYADCAKIFSTVREPALGKPLRVSDMRLFKNNDKSFSLTISNQVFAYIYPDNTILFPTDEEKLYYTTAFKLVYCLGRVMPIWLHRVGTGRYRIGGHCDYKDIKYLPEYFGGIRFSLTDGVCLNRRPDRKDRVNPDRRKVWLRTLKKHREGVLSRLKLGLRGDAKAGCRHYPEVEELYKWLTHEEYPDILFDSINAEAHGPTYEQQAAAYKRIIGRHVTGLHKLFGMYND